jgi:septum formation protein
MLVLASQSPRRQELLRAAAIDFRVVVPSIPELVPRYARRRYADIVQRTALAKAQAVAARAQGIILAADTIVVCSGEILGKPRTERDARRMLERLSGRWHRVYTGVALLDEQRRLLGYERTEVALRRLSKNEIDSYVRTGEPMDKAGSYAIQGQGAALIRAVRGCYTNVIGLPLPKVLAMLQELGHLPNRSQGQRGGAHT